MKLLVDHDTPRKPGEKQFQLDEWIEGSPFESLLGTEILQADKGAAVLTLPYTVKLSNGGGVMHGGAMTSLADTAVAMAIKSLVAEGTPFVTTELRMVFLAPILEGRVTARARVTGPVGRTYDGECELFDENGSLCARMTSVFKLLKPE